jgi:glycosyltransferase involved in cell wall biosynthesis
VYLERLLAELPAAGVEPIAVANVGRRPPAGGGPGSVANLAADARWTALTLPRLARRHGARLIHHPLPARSLGPGLRQVVTVHDLAFELLAEAFPAAYRRYASLTHRHAARRAHAVVAVSQATASALTARWNIPGGRVIVAHHGPGQDLPDVPPAAVPTHFLYVGDDEPRKGLPALLDAYRDYRKTPERAGERPLPLILAGRRLADVSRPGVRVERGADPARLAALYSGAAALVHPALEEGFGLTVLEAMRAGAPVLAAGVPAVREVAADAALLVPPGDTAALSAALIRLAADPALCARLRAAGRERARAFTWARCARAHAAAYSLALDGQPD